MTQSLSLTLAQYAASTSISSNPGEVRERVEACGGKFASKARHHLNSHLLYAVGAAVAVAA